jgi:hypothetical protein
MTRRAKNILTLDGSAALIAALFMFTLREPLARLHGFEPAFVTALAAVNALYGCYSGTLAVRAWRGLLPSRASIDLLIAGNATWSIICVGIIAFRWTSSTAWGVAHVGLEGVFVACLAAAERRWVRPLTSARQDPRAG